MKKKRINAAAIAFGLALGAVQAQAQPQARPGDGARYLAATCANCHGTDGHSVGGGGMPGLAGMSRAYLIEQMNAFRAGGRRATIMHQLAKGFTDEQIAQLAEFFSQRGPAGQGGAR